MTKKEQEVLSSFIEEFAEKILDGKASLFVGSGFSRPANLPNWKELLEKFAKEINLEIDKEEHNLISLAQYYVNAKKRPKLNDEIRNRFSYSKMPSSVVLPNHDLLAALPIKNIWTTNYDQLLEETLKKHNIIPICLTDDSTIGKINSKNGVVIHKIHGDADTPEKCVITKADYDLYTSTHEMLLAKLKAEMCYNTFLFLGYSFNDTNIQHILSRIRAIFGDSKKQRKDLASPNRHYCIFAKNANKYDNQRQRHHIDDLKSYGIYPILIDSFEQITDVLKRIRNRVCKKNVFVSGSYPDELLVDEKEIVHNAATAIATSLIVSNYSIYSGYGKNLGVDIVQGAHDGYFLSQQDGSKIFDVKIGMNSIVDSATPKEVKELAWLNNHLFIFPFPFNKNYNSDNERAQQYEKWRKLIIEKTQVTILISGKKIDSNNNVVDADGVYDEFKISDAQGNLIIPIEFTGGMAKSIWNELSKRDSEYYKSALFQKLKDPNAINGTINKIIEKYALNI